jgi:hypothetical protein
MGVCSFVAWHASHLTGRQWGWHQKVHGPRYHQALIRLRLPEGRIVCYHALMCYYRVTTHIYKDEKNANRNMNSLAHVILLWKTCAK